MLRGIVIPTDWNRVNAVFQVFCEIGDIDPDAARWDDDGRDNADHTTNRQYLRQLWDEALEDEPDPSSIRRPTIADDPWASESPSPGFSDEPPF